MSFDFGSLKKKKEKKKTTSPRPVTPRQSPLPTPKTPQMSEEKLVSVIGQVFDDKIQVLTKTIENQAIQPPVEPDVIRDLTKLIETQRDKIQELQPASIHVFNERNALLFAMRTSRAGYKPKGMFEYFETEDGSIIDDDTKAMDRYFKKNGFVKENKSGWRKLTEKGRKRLEELKQGNPCITGA